MNIEFRIPNLKRRNCGFAGRYSRFVPLLLCCCALMHFVAGCGNGNKESPLVEQIRQLTQERKQLQKQIEQATNANKQLKKQVHVLSGLPEQVKGENLYSLQQIKITGYTNLYDKDDDGKKEKLIVYIQPVDQDGDIIKATGSVDVQLWDLNKKASEALLGQWQVEPDELRKLWIALLVINYRLAFDVGDKVDDFEEPLTVKVTFTDYLTGKVFKEQKVIEPRDY